jgi:hypothetical protein
VHLALDLSCKASRKHQLDLLFNRSPAKMGTMPMSDIFHRSLMPSPYSLPERALSYVQYVIINWLDVEVDETPPEWRPLLNDLTGWRNREVYYYLEYVAPDWTARMTGPKIKGHVAE